MTKTGCSVNITRQCVVGCSKTVLRNGTPTNLELEIRPCSGTGQLSLLQVGIHLFWQLHQQRNKHFFNVQASHSWTRVKGYWLTDVNKAPMLRRQARRISSFQQT